VQKANGTNLRAQFRADTQGKFWFRAVRPSSYPVPTDGPVGNMLQATRRHAMRPGHLHFVLSAPGHERLVTHLFIKGDPYLESDAVFAVKESLVVDCARMDAAQEARQYQVEAPFYRLHYDFVLKPA
jgi:hydroxyquinol 1,2-dioxygenase